MVTVYPPYHSRIGDTLNRKIGSVQKVYTRTHELIRRNTIFCTGAE